nr:hypothetical transcript [Hymenolepis microstoma]
MSVKVQVLYRDGVSRQTPGRGIRTPQLGGIPSVGKTTKANIRNYVSKLGMFKASYKLRMIQTKYIRIPFSVLKEVRYSTTSLQA